jgi:hypothetical protein
MGPVFAQSEGKYNVEKTRPSTKFDKQGTWYYMQP